MRYLLFVATFVTILCSSYIAKVFLKGATSPYIIDDNVYFGLYNFLKSELRVLLINPLISFFGKNF